MNEKNIKEHKPFWKGCIIFGIINILLVLLCTNLNVLMISSAMIILIIIGVVISFHFIIENWKSGFKASALGCIVGFLLQCFAGLWYGLNILSGLISLFIH